MSGLSPERREELAALLLRHGHAEWDEFDGQVVTDALAPLIAGWLAEASEEGEDRQRGRDYDDGYEAGAAEVRARVEAVLEPAIRMDEKGYRNAASDALPAIRAALNGGESDV